MAKATAETVTKTVTKTVKTEAHEKVINLQLSEEEAKTIFCLGGEMNLDGNTYGGHMFAIRRALAKHVNYTYFKDRFGIRDDFLYAKPISK